MLNQVGTRATLNLLPDAVLRRELHAACRDGLTRPRRIEVLEYRWLVDAHRLHHADLAHVPLYHMMIPWAHRQGVAVRHRADNQFQVREIKMD